MSLVSEHNRKEGYVFMAEYQEKYGDSSIPPLGDLCGFPSIDEFCRVCLENGKRWEDYANLPEGEPGKDYIY